MTCLVLQVLASKSPSLLDFHEDLISLEAASKVNMISLSHCRCGICERKYFGNVLIGTGVLQIQLKSLAEEMQSIIKGLEKVKHELAASENDGPVSEVFHKVST